LPSNRNAAQNLVRRRRPEWGCVIGTRLSIDDVRATVLNDVIDLTMVILPLFAVFIRVIFLLRGPSLACSAP
jgi:hypothetical protein